jgi:hypothetical protein
MFFRKQNFESTHNHSAYAQIERDKKQDEGLRTRSELNAMQGFTQSSILI